MGHGGRNVRVAHIAGALGVVRQHNLLWDVQHLGWRSSLGCGPLGCVAIQRFHHLHEDRVQLGPARGGVQVAKRRWRWRCLQRHPRNGVATRRAVVPAQDKCAHARRRKHRLRQGLHCTEQRDRGRGGHHPVLPRVPVGQQTTRKALRPSAIPIVHWRSHWLRSFSCRTARYGGCRGRTATRDERQDLQLQVFGQVLHEASVGEVSCCGRAHVF